jgi:SAM-dependent methyltransferase
MAGPRAGAGVQPDEASSRRCREAPLPVCGRYTAGPGRGSGNPGSPPLRTTHISRKILLVFCFHYSLRPDTGKQLPEAARYPGRNGTSHGLHDPGPTHEGSSAMTEPAAPCGTTSTRPPRSANGPGPPPPPAPRRGAPRQPAYSQDARSYDHRTGAFQAYRQAIVGALPLRRGQVVLDVGCGTGLCYGFLVEKVGPQGGVVGIEESPEMAAIARERIAREGWHNVTVVQSGAEDAQIAVTADAALFCAVHDILQSPDALRNVMDHLRPGAPVAAGGGKWAAPWMMAVNLQTRMLHAPYVRSFEGFGRPWNHLEQLIDDVHVRELAFGSGYVLTGRSRSRRTGSRAVTGRGRRTCRQISP